MRAPKARAWVFTLNNPTNEIQLHEDAVYCIYQLESAPTTKTPHYQGFCYFKNSVTLKKIKDWLGTSVHAEIARDCAASITYCSKEDSRICGPFELGRKPNFNIPELIRSCTELPTLQFLQHCVDNKIPYGYYSEVIRLTSQDANTIRETDPTWTTRCKRELQYFKVPENTLQSMVMVGPSGCGKTSWAKANAPKPALFVTHLDDLRKLTPEHKSIIFDDMDFKHLPRTSQIHLVDMYDTRSIHVRYGTATIPAGIHKIFTANDFPFIIDEAIQRRIKTFQF